MYSLLHCISIEYTFHVQCHLPNLCKTVHLVCSDETVHLVRSDETVHLVCANECISFLKNEISSAISQTTTIFQDPQKSNGGHDLNFQLVAFRTKPGLGDSSRSTTRRRG